jgi:hypothetical protein
VSNTRRRFLQSAALAAGLAANRASAEAAPQTLRPGAAPTPASDVQVPKIKFGNVEISRLVAGCNPFYGFAHFNDTLGTVMREYYTAERVCQVLHQCNLFGINAYNYVGLGRAQQDFERFAAEGGRMHLIVQGMNDTAAVVKSLKPLAVYHHGEHTDRAYRNGGLASVREWCKKTRDLGVMVGVGSHNPQILAQVEDEGWDIDFYAGCVYNRTRTTDEWKQVLNNELVEMQGECYLRSDPPRMYHFMRSTKKPCFAFKIMAAGRIGGNDADQAFRTAYESIKPYDGVFIGLFPRVRDEVKENAERVHRILAAA